MGEREAREKRHLEEQRQMKLEHERREQLRLERTCSPANVGPCDDVKKEKFINYLAMDLEGLAVALQNVEKQIQDEEAKIRREWTVHIDKKEDEKLGAAIGDWNDHYKINDLQDGAIKNFNEANPGDDIVRNGDVITKANSAVGRDAMRAEFPKGIVTLSMLRECSPEA